MPADYVALPALPLTANGKVDRRALPAPAALPAAADSTAPRTPVEEAVAAIWSDVLGLPAPGVHDNFFEAGGHSLLATRAVSRLRSAFQVDLPLQALFEQPTVAGLARRVERAVAAGTGPAAPPIVPLPGGEEPTLSFAQERLWLVEQLQPDLALYNIPVALRVAGPLRLAALAAALCEVPRRHQVLRTLFGAAVGAASTPAGRGPGRPAGGRSRRLAGRPPRAGGLDARRRGGAPPVRPGAAAGMADRRAAVGRRPARRPDHGASHRRRRDGRYWSWCASCRPSTPPSPPAAGSALGELPIRYSDFAHWQRLWLRGEVLARQLDYWRGQLAGAPPLLDLPTDRPRPAIQGFRGAELPFSLPPGLAERLRVLCREQGTTLFMVLLAAFEVLLARHSGQSDVSIGTPIAGRTETQTEDLIGFFVNTLVLRGDLSGDPSFELLLARTRQLALDAYAHQDLPVREAGRGAGATALSRSLDPLFQVIAGGARATPRATLCAGGAFPSCGAWDAARRPAPSSP